MKTTISTLIIAAALMGCLNAHAQPASPKVGVHVTAKSADDRRKIVDSTSLTTIEKHTLLVTLRGRAMDSEKRVAKWYVFGRNIKTQQMSVLDSGEVNVSFPANGVQTFESREVTCAFTPMHTVSTGSGKRTKAKRVDAAGVKIIGFGAQVKDGGKIVGEFFSERDLIQNTR